MNAFLARIRERAAATPRTIALPEATDPRVAAAAVRLHADRLARPLLVGDRGAAAAAIRGAGGEPADFDVVDPTDDPRAPDLAAALLERRRDKGMDEDAAREAVADPLVFADMLLATGAVDGCVAGAVATTADVLRAAIRCVGLAPGIATVSSSFYMVVPERGEGAAPGVYTFTDGAVMPAPTAAQLADIAAAAADARRAIVGDEPRVAFLSYSTRGSAAGPSVDAARDALARFREMRPDVPADGELQLDAAVVPYVAARKASDSPLAGRANVLVFPDLDAGNIGYKLAQRFGGAEAIGPILQGLARPCSDLSRGASVEDVVNVVCIVSLLAGA